MRFDLTIDRLRKRFGRTEALKAVDLAVPRGALFGLVGLNGAGKTTTLDCALGLLRPDDGTIRILGLPPSRIARSAGRVSSVSDTDRLPSSLSVRQTLEHARIAGGRAGRSPAEAASLLGIEHLQDRKARHLSHGNRRRLSIAAALLGHPELLILDEPFSGLDAAGVEDVLALLARLNREEGLTVILSSHQIHQVESICSHVGIIHEGATVAQGSLDAILRGERARLCLRVDDRKRAIEVLESMEGVQAVHSGAGAEIEVELAGAEPAAVNRELVGAGVAVSKLLPCRPSLLAYFQSCIKSSPETSPHFAEKFRMEGCGREPAATSSPATSPKSGREPAGREKE
jgi:ABC-type multidrug transport system ATPase subunit